jgi:prophage regulatory protein
MSIRFIKASEVMRRTGLSKMSIWRGQKAGTFPHSVRLGPNSVGWVEVEIEAWCAARIAERDGHEDPSTNTPIDQNE